MHAVDIMAREKQLNIRLSGEESERIELLTKHYGINTAALIRMLVKREADAVTSANARKIGADVYNTTRDIREGKRKPTKRPAK